MRSIQYELATHHRITSIGVIAAASAGAVVLRRSRRR